MPRDELAELSGIYGPRHNLSSIADRAHAPDEVRNLVGNWSDGQCRTKMADRYSFARCERHYEIRTELLSIARKAIENTVPMISASTEDWISKIKVESPDWELIFECWPRGPKGRMLGNSIFPNAPTIEELKDAVTSSAEKHGTATQSSSSSASDTSDAEEHEENSFSCVPWHFWPVTKADNYMSLTTRSRCASGN